MNTELKGKAYAIYSNTDNSLTFIRAVSAPIKGDTLDGKVVTEVFGEFEEEVYYNYYKVPWSLRRDNILKVIVRDTIMPISTSMWFNGFTKCVTMDLTNLNTSRVESMDYMFGRCEALQDLDLSHFNMSNVKTKSGMFFRCKSEFLKN